MWWILSAFYVAGAMMTFRVAYLRFMENSERAIEACTDHNYGHSTSCQRESRHHEGNGMVAAFTALWWPVVATCFLVWKAMFPRGAVTRYAKQKAVEQKQAAKQKELENLAREIKRTSKAAGLTVPEGL